MLHPKVATRQVSARSRPLVCQAQLCGLRDEEGMVRIDGRHVAFGCGV
jgi:hypothetical protein